MFSLAAAIVSCIREEEYGSGTCENIQKIADDLVYRYADAKQHYEDTSVASRRDL